MDLDAVALGFAVVSTESYKGLVGRGLNAAMLAGRARDAWQFIQQHIEQYGSIPTAGVVVDRTGAKVDPPPEGVPPEYLVDLLHERSIGWTLRDGLRSAAEALNRGDQDAAVAAAIELAEAIRLKRADQTQLRPLSETIAEVLQLYERTKQGLTGIPLPWPTMHRMTLGLWPGTLTFFVARPGVGKTWVAVVTAYHAWRNGYRVLVVSPEISRVEFVERMLALHARVPYGDLVAARLGSFNEPALHRAAAEMASIDGLHVLDDESQMDFDGVERSIEASKPQLVVVDSLYMLRTARRSRQPKRHWPDHASSRYERILFLVDWLRSLSRRFQLPIVGLSQMARTTGKLSKDAADQIKHGHGTGGLEDMVAMSDTILQDAHNIFALYQDHDMRLDKLMLYVPLKVRRQAAMDRISTRWDLETMDFSEVGSSEFVPGQIIDPSRASPAWRDHPDCPDQHSPDAQPPSPPEHTPSGDYTDDFEPVF